MSRGLWDQSGDTLSTTLQHIAGTTLNLSFQRNEIHGNVMNIQNNYSGGSYPDWKPSRRCAALDFGRLSRHFCGRDRELEQLDSVFKAGEGSVRCAIQGISGIGKSHLAIQYGKMSFESEKYTHVFWISADTETKLFGGLESVLVKLDHPAQFESDQKTKVEVVRRWLEDAGEDQWWLLIFDNARRECFESLRNNIPNNMSHGHILLTTQFEDIAKVFVNSQLESLSLLRLQPLAIDDGVSLLIASSEMVSDDLSSQDRDKARRLVQCTGCHPLAITFAAACATTASSLPDLLRQTSTDQLVMITEHEDTLADTDQRVIKQLFDRQLAHIQDDPLALDLFRTLSFLDNTSVSVQMLWRGIQFSQFIPANAESAAQKSKTVWHRGLHFMRTAVRRAKKAVERPPLFTCQMPDLHNSIKKLASQNLIQVAGSGTIGMHDLTNHMSLRSMEVTGVASAYQGDACWIISSAFEAIEDPLHRDSWATSEEIIPHVFKLSYNPGKIQSGFGSALDSVAFYLLRRGRYPDSLILYGRLVDMCQRDLGSRDPDTLTAMHSMASAYQSQDRFGEAEDLYQHVLRERKNRLGPSHPYTLSTTNNLACVYVLQGRFLEAGELYQHIWDEDKKRLGSTHPDTLMTMHNMASVYESQDRLREAEELLCRVLDERKKQIGSTHPDTLMTMHNLAGVHQAQSNLQAAEELFQQALDERKKELGPMHPHTLSTMRRLALVYDSRDRRQEAEELLQTALTGIETIFGPDHDRTVSAKHDLESVRWRIAQPDGG